MQPTPVALPLRRQASSPTSSVSSPVTSKRQRVSAVIQNEDQSYDAPQAKGEDAYTPLVSSEGRVDTPLISGKGGAHALLTSDTGRTQESREKHTSNSSMGAASLPSGEASSHTLKEEAVKLEAAISDKRRESMKERRSSQPPYRRGGKMLARSCPYLGTINRHLLDFDFEKLCSVCLSNQHVYACLVCGKFFQGRGRDTYAYTHALEDGHYMYMNLKDCKVYCLPENYEVEDASLDDISYYLHPKYYPETVRGLNSTVMYGKALDGTDFLPGCIGLNNLKKTDYFNVVIQMICKITALRNALLLLDLSDHQSPDIVLQTLGELIRKIYNPKNFKGIASPHEFLQAVGVASQKSFRIGKQKDPLALLTWLFNRLSKKGMKKSSSTGSQPSIGEVTDHCLKGEVLVKTSRGESAELEEGFVEEVRPFTFLTLTPPEAPIFKDSLDRNMIPQVPIFDLLRKFDGVTGHEAVPGHMKRYSLWRLPPMLILNISRFSKNNFFVEKNPTIVTFPVKNLDLRDYVHPEAAEANPITRFNLVANVCHQGQPHEGIYKVHVHHTPTDEWYEIEDLRVTPVLPQFVALSESYIQLYQRQDVKCDGTIDEEMSVKALKELGGGSMFEFLADFDDDDENLKV